MSVLTEIDPSQSEQILRALVSIIGWNNWKKRIRTLSSQLNENILLADVIRSRHAIEIQLGRTFEIKRTTGRIPGPRASPEQYRLLSFAAALTQIHSVLSDKGKRRLAGMLTDGLKSDNGLLPLEHEMVTATHLFGKKFEVIFNDLEYGTGFDFLARRNGKELEVECKTITADIGRQIHVRDLVSLGRKLQVSLHSWVDANSGGCLVKVLLPGRLHKRQEYQTSLAQSVTAVVESPSCPIENEICSIKLDRFSLEDIISIEDGNSQSALEKLRQFVETKVGSSSTNCLVNYRRGKSVIIVAIESQKPDKVIRGIYRQLKQASAAQFTGERPACLCIRLADLTEEELLSVAQGQGENRESGTGLQIMSTAIMEKHPHLHTLSYVTPGKLISQRQETGSEVTTSIQERGPAYTFINKSHPMHSDESYSVFT